MGSPFRLLVMAMSMTVTAPTRAASPAAAVVIAVVPASTIAALPGFISAFVPAFADVEFFDLFARFDRFDYGADAEYKVFRHGIGRFVS